MSSCMSSRLVTMSPTGAPIPIPALLTNTSRRPQRSRCAATTFWISASWETSAATPWTSRPSPANCATAPSSFSARRAAIVTVWPSSPSTLAIASPMPLEAPVTIAARCVVCAICAFLLVVDR